MNLESILFNHIEKCKQSTKSKSLLFNLYFGIIENNCFQSNIPKNKYDELLEWITQPFILERNKLSQPSISSFQIYSKNNIECYIENKQLTKYLKHPCEVHYINHPSIDIRNEIFYYSEYDNNVSMYQFDQEYLIDQCKLSHSHFDIIFEYKINLKKQEIRNLYIQIHNWNINISQLCFFIQILSKHLTLHNNKIIELKSSHSNESIN